MNQHPTRTRTVSNPTHRPLQKSSTLNRRYVKQPKAPNQQPTPQITSSALSQSELLRRRQALAAEINRSQLVKIKQQRSTAKTIDSPDLPAVQHPYQQIAKQRLAPRPTSALSPQELKSQAIKRALASMDQIAQSTPQAAPTSAQESSNLSKALKKQSRGKKTPKLILAFSCAAACVALLGYLVHLNMPDLSVRVAAVQAGISATYPSYIPQDFQLASVSSGKDQTITMVFHNPAKPTQKFTLTETKSSWDSSALLNNFVKHEWDDNYTVTREQGITIYIAESNAAWVNGGIFYQIHSDNTNTLAKDQIKNIATSL